MYIFLASNSEWKIYRKLYSFESAYVSLKRIIGSVEELSNQLRLVLIRNYWNPLIDEELLNVSEGFKIQSVQISKLEMQSDEFLSNMVLCSILNSKFHKLDLNSGTYSIDETVSWVYWGTRRF